MSIAYMKRYVNVSTVPRWRSSNWFVGPVTSYLKVHSLYTNNDLLRRGLKTFFKIFALNRLSTKFLLSISLGPSPSLGHAELS